MQTEYIGSMDRLHGAKETLTVADLDEANAASWQRFVEKHRDANLYHTLIWRDVIEQVFGHVIQGFIADRKRYLDRRLCAMFTRCRA